MTHDRKTPGELPEDHPAQLALRNLQGLMRLRDEGKIPNPYAWAMAASYTLVAAANCDDPADGKYLMKEAARQAAEATRAMGRAIGAVEVQVPDDAASLMDE